MENIKDISKKEFENWLDSYQVAENECVDDVTLWPATGEVRLYLFLFNWEDGEFTKEKLKAYKSSEAYNYCSR